MVPSWISHVEAVTTVSRACNRKTSVVKFQPAGVQMPFKQKVDQEALSFLFRSGDVPVSRPAEGKGEGETNINILFGPQK